MQAEGSSNQAFIKKSFLPVEARYGFQAFKKLFKITMENPGFVPSNWKWGIQQIVEGERNACKPFS